MDMNLGKARQICDAVRKNFPYESPWKHFNIDYRGFSKQNQTRYSPEEVLRIKELLAHEDEKLKYVRQSCAPFYSEPLLYFKQLIKSIHKHKVQNCGEATRVAYAVSRMNGVKDSALDTALLITKPNKDYSNSLFPAVDKFFDFLKEVENGGGGEIIDHVALKLRDKKGRELIIDPLLNECQSKEFMERVYKSKYGDVLKISAKENVQIYDGSSYLGKIPCLRDGEARELLEIYPELDVFGVLQKKKAFSLFGLFCKK